MGSDLTTGEIIQAFWARIDAQDWAGLGELLDPGLQVHYLHTGERLRGAQFVQVNQQYPGRWHVTLADLVEHGNRAASRAQVSDGSVTYHVASFATVRDGLIAELTELWNTGDVPIPADRRLTALRRPG